MGRSSPRKNRSAKAGAYGPVNVSVPRELIEAGRARQGFTFSEWAVKGIREGLGIDQLEQQIADTRRLLQRLEEEREERMLVEEATRIREAVAPLVKAFLQQHGRHVLDSGRPTGQFQSTFDAWYELRAAEDDTIAQVSREKLAKEILAWVAA